MSAELAPIVGRWRVEVVTPFGEQVIALEFSDERTGTARYGAESIALGGVTTTGNHSSWTVALTQPLKVTLQCAVTVDHDSMSGTARAGFFGSVPLRGRRD